VTTDPDKLLRKINDATNWSKRHYFERVEAIKNAEEDVDESKRVLIARECRWCYYIYNTRMAGQAFTPWTCPGCVKSFAHPNTATPKYCKDCAYKYRVCVTCGGDQNMAVKRRKLTYEH
jgi:hypothetical protein